MLSIQKVTADLCGCSVFDQSISRLFGLMRIKLGFEQCPGLLFPNRSVLSKPIVWLGDYVFNSKSDSRLCGCSVFDQSIGRLFGLMRITFGFKQCTGLLF